MFEEVVMTLACPLLWCIYPLRLDRCGEAPACYSAEQGSANENLAERVVSDPHPEVTLQVSNSQCLLHHGLILELMRPDQH